MPPSENVGNLRGECLGWLRKFENTEVVGANLAPPLHLGVTVREDVVPHVHMPPRRRVAIIATDTEVIRWTLRRKIAARELVGIAACK